MIDCIGMHTIYEAQLISYLGRKGKQLTNPAPTLAMLCKMEWTSDHRQTRLIAAHRRQPLPATNLRWKLLPVSPIELRFVIEQIHLRGTA